VHNRMPYALYTSRRYCGVAFIFLCNPRIKRTGTNNCQYVWFCWIKL